MQSLFYMKGINMPNLKTRFASMAGEYFGHSVLKNISNVTKELENWASKIL